MAPDWQSSVRGFVAGSRKSISAALTRPRAQTIATPRTDPIESLPLTPANPSTPPSDGPDTRRDSASLNHSSDALSSEARSFSREGAASKPVRAGLSDVDEARQLSASMMDNDVPAELRQFYHAFNTHSQKLYLEGHFLKLHDLDSNGKPPARRSWTECYAQLVGSVLLLWNTAAIDQAEGQVQPTEYIRIVDGTMKMIDSLPTGTNSNGPLQNVLSLSTAGDNRYLFHFRTTEDLHRWTAALRLSIFEATCLHENYTGCLLSAKGRELNSMNELIAGTVRNTENWARVRFGAGTPWRRCWYVVSPPSVKEIKMHQREAKKSKSVYSRPLVPTGTIRFYNDDGRKVKRSTVPVATITDTHAAYAIFPEFHDLTAASTLVKIEGTVTIGSDPTAKTDGFVFVMPEPRPPVSGTEVMFQILYPIWNAFRLYGRPVSLISDPKIPSSLLFGHLLSPRMSYGITPLEDVCQIVAKSAGSELSAEGWRKAIKEAAITALPHLTGPTAAILEDGRSVGFITGRGRSLSESPSIINGPFQPREGGHSRKESTSSTNTTHSLRHKWSTQRLVIPDELMRAADRAERMGQPSAVMSPPAFSDRSTGHLAVAVRPDLETMRRHSGLDSETTEQIEMLGSVRSGSSALARTPSPGVAVLAGTPAAVQNRAGGPLHPALMAGREPVPRKAVVEEGPSRYTPYAPQSVDASPVSVSGPVTPRDMATHGAGAAVRPGSLPDSWAGPAGGPENEGPGQAFVWRPGPLPDSKTTGQHTGHALGSPMALRDLREQRHRPSGSDGSVGSVGYYPRARPAHSFGRPGTATPPPGSAPHSRTSSVAAAGRDSPGRGRTLATGSRPGTPRGRAWAESGSHSRSQSGSSPGSLMDVIVQRERARAEGLQLKGRQRLIDVIVDREQEYESRDVMAGLAITSAAGPARQ